MQEQLCPPVTIRSGFDLNQAINDLRFYWNLAKQKGVSFEMELWSERGLIVPPRMITTERRVPVEA